MASRLLDGGAGGAPLRTTFWLLVVFAVGVILGAVLMARDGYDGVGVLGATEQEADEGYFSFGQNRMLVAKQGSDLHTWLHAHVGQRVRVRIDPEGGQ